MDLYGEYYKSGKDFKLFILCAKYVKVYCVSDFTVAHSNGYLCVKRILPAHFTNKLFRMNSLCSAMDDLKKRA